MLVFLSRQCCAIRDGDENENDGNLMQLLKLCGGNDSRLEQWMMKDRDKYLSHEAQNDMLTIMKLKVFRGTDLCIHLYHYG